MVTAKTAPAAAEKAAKAAAPGKAVQSLDVVILERTYTVACPDGERDKLLTTVAYLDAKMREIRATGKVVGNDRIAVMAALNIAHEHLTAKSPVGGVDIGDAKRTISAMHSMIDEAIESQEKLF